MARFEIEQYELHVATYEVEAPSAAEAIRRLLDGDGDPLDGSVYVRTSDDVGMNVADDPHLAQELRELGVQVRGSIVPSIRRVRRLENPGEELPES
jgi:hypothetical protein